MSGGSFLGGKVLKGNFLEREFKVGDFLGGNSPGGECPAVVFSVGTFWEGIYLEPGGRVTKSERQMEVRRGKHLKGVEVEG